MEEWFLVLKYNHNPFSVFYTYNIILDPTAPIAERETFFYWLYAWNK